MRTVSIALLVCALTYYAWFQYWRRTSRGDPVADRDVPDTLTAAETRFVFNQGRFDVRTWEVALIEMRVSRMITWECREAGTGIWEIDPAGRPEPAGPVPWATLRRTGATWLLGNTARKVMTQLFPPGVDECDIESPAASASRAALKTALHGTVASKYFKSVGVPYAGIALNALGILTWTLFAPPATAAGSEPMPLILAKSAFAGVWISVLSTALMWFSLPPWFRGAGTFLIIPIEWEASLRDSSPGILAAQTLLLCCMLAFGVYILSPAALPTLHFAAGITALFTTGSIPTAAGRRLLRRIENDRRLLESRAHDGSLRPAEVPFAVALDAVRIAPVLTNNRDEKLLDLIGTWRTLRVAQELLDRSPD